MGGAFFKAAGSVPGEPELAEFGEEGIEFGGEGQAAILGERGDVPGVGFDAGNPQAAGKSHQVRRHAQFTLDEVRIGTLHGGVVEGGHDGVDALDGGVQGIGLENGIERLVVAVAYQVIENAAVPRHVFTDLVGIAEVVDQTPHETGFVLEDMDIERPRDVDLRVGGGAPRHARAIGESGIGGGLELPVSAVAPVGDQVADGAVGQAVLRRIAQVGEGVVRFPGEGIPGRGAGHDVEGDTRVRELFPVLGKGMIRFIAPFHRDDVLGQLRNQFGVVHDDVAPELHGASVARADRVDFHQEFEVDHARAARFAGFLAPALAQGPGFVAADVHLPARKTGQQTVVHVLDQRDAARVHRAQIAAAGCLGEGGIARQRQPPAHVPEGILVRDQFDPAIAAVDIEHTDLRGRHWRGVDPHLGMIPVGEGVLGIHLDLIDFPLGESVHQPPQGVHLGYLAPRHIEHDAPVREIRPVLDTQTGQGPFARILPRQLLQRHGPMPQTREIVRGKMNTAFLDFEHIALGLRRFRGVDGHIQRNRLAFPRHSDAFQRRAKRFEDKHIWRMCPPLLMLTAFRPSFAYPLPQLDRARYGNKNQFRNCR